MKKYWYVIIVILLLTACGSETAVENTAADLEFLSDSAAATLEATILTVPSEENSVAAESPTETATVENSVTVTPLPPTETAVATQQPTAEPSIHIVVVNDTLFDIAQTYNTTVAAIQILNDLDQSTVIFPGMELLIAEPDDTVESAVVTATDTPSTSATSTSEALPDSSTDVPDGGLTPNVITTSYWGNPIESYVIGNGEKDVFLVGGIHGGYEWNTILLVYEALDMFLANPELVPASITLHIIPNANPDGLYKVTGTTGRFAASDVNPDTFPGRTNGNDVDLNRNWDCNWRAEGLWRDQPISGGTQPFSETETAGLKAHFEAINPEVVVFYHSAVNGVFASGCPEVSAENLDLANLYGAASGYPVYEQFGYYEVTGDAGDYLATVGIPSFSVELINHDDLDWAKNKNGMLALLQHIAAN